MSLPSTRVPFENPPRPEEDVPPAWEPTAFWGHQTFWNSHLLLVHRLMRGASLFLPHFWNINFAQFDFNYFSIDIRKCEDIDHANVAFRTGQRSTYMVLADDLVSAGTMLVTPGIGWQKKYLLSKHWQEVSHRLTNLLKNHCNC